MTPEEKAKYLFDKFSNGGDVREGAAIEFVEICCDEIISVLSGEGADWLTCTMNDALRYWNQVKQHIQQL